MTTSPWNIDSLVARANNARARREGAPVDDRIAHLRLLTDDIRDMYADVDDGIIATHQRMLTVGVQEMYAEQDAYAADLLAAGDAGAYGTGGAR